MGLLLLILLIVLLVGTVPAWPYSRSWGYAPAGGLGTVVLILLILLLLGWWARYGLSAWREHTVLAHLGQQMLAAVIIAGTSLMTMIGCWPVR